MSKINSKLERAFAAVMALRALIVGAAWDGHSGPLATSLQHLTIA